ncbi:DNA repair protein RecN [Candidatus Binatia bacterium]|nr:DNA repair protein RecN [Candidatus Binatia bacterium]
MLRHLRIANFAVIDELDIGFAAGMNVLTGETGAGKSVITRAIDLLCGGRGNVDVIRTEAREALIEGLFDADDAVRRVLVDGGFEDADELLVRRVISRTGKGRIHINGAMANTALLSQLGSRLVHVYGQHEQALLLRPDSHLELLDQFAGLGDTRAEMAAAYADYRDALERWQALTACGEVARQRAELLRFQVDELRAARVEAGLEAALQQERERQRHAEKLARLCQEGDEILYAGDGAVVGVLGRLAGQLADAARIDPGFGEGADLTRQAASQIEEVALQLRRAGDRIRVDPERLDEVENRLALLARLKRKYEIPADALPGRLAALEAELVVLEGGGTDPAAAQREVDIGAERALALAQRLSAARRAAAGRLERCMGKELAALGMDGALFRIEFARSARGAGAETATPADLTATGIDVIEFFLSANPGEDPAPLARIASGGELSRIMLGLKALTAGAGEVPTLIFDEVDAGIGGGVAEQVGQRLRGIARGRQVLCITHLPQIAVLADHHLAVEKRVAGGRTFTTARGLDADERVREIGRMLGPSTGVDAERYARRIMAAARPTED